MALVQLEDSFQQASGRNLIKHTNASNSIKSKDKLSHGQVNQLAGEKSMDLPPI